MDQYVESFLGHEIAGGENEQRLGQRVGFVIGFECDANADHAKFVGVETAPLPFVIAWSRARSSRLQNLRIIYGNIWKQDLGPFDVAYAFLSPAPMPRLYEKVKAEMRPGTLFVSNSFAVPEAPPDQTVSVSDSRATQLFVWRR